MENWAVEEDRNRKRYLAIGVLAAATTLNDTTILEEWLPRLKEVIDQEAVEEVVLQTLLFAGFPKTIEAMKIVRKYYPQAGKAKQVGNHEEAGFKISKAIYGKHHPKLIRIMDDLHPDLRRWMIEDGYGRVLSRPGLSIKDREIAVLASLMAGGMPNQYLAHLRACVFVGIRAEDIVWFIRIFDCIIPSLLKDKFEQITKQTLDLLK